MFITNDNSSSWFAHIIIQPLVIVIVNKLVLVKVKVYNSTSPSLANLLSTVLFIAVTAAVCNLNKNTDSQAKSFPAAASPSLRN